MAFFDLWSRAILSDSAAKSAKWSRLTRSRVGNPNDSAVPERRA
jgi:hypothetical protein